VQGIIATNKQGSKSELQMVSGAEVSVYISEGEFEGGEDLIIKI